MDLFIECNVELCKTDCEPCPDANQVTLSRKLTCPISQRDALFSLDNVVFLCSFLHLPANRTGQTTPIDKHVRGIDDERDDVKWFARVTLRSDTRRSSLQSDHGGRPEQSQQRNFATARGNRRRRGREQRDQRLHDAQWFLHCYLVLLNHHPCHHRQCGYALRQVAASVRIEIHLFVEYFTLTRLTINSRLLSIFLYYTAFLSSVRCSSENDKSRTRNSER